MEVVIPSRHRANIIINRTLKFFPNAIVCVDQNESIEYKPICKKIITHPSLNNLPKIINFILGNADIPGESIVIVDDDLKRVQTIAQHKTTDITNPVDIMAVVENCSIMARGFGSPLWGFSVNRRPDSNYSYKPFSLAARIGSFRGISDRAIREDEHFCHHDDVDLTLQCLLTHRTVFRDDRFNFIFEPIYNTPGGNFENLKIIQMNDERRLLKQKWGRFVFFVDSPHHWRETRINVER